MQRTLFLLLLSTFLFPFAHGVHADDAQAEDVRPGYFRYPALHGSTLVFSAEGDLWTIPLAGGDARRLTTHLEEETHPSISPDGERLAFTAAYDDSREVYVMPLSGGLPQRLTWHGGTVVGWTDEGEVLYRTRAFSLLNDAQIAAVDPQTGESELMPLAQAATGAWNADATTFFFTRQDFQGSHAKRYRGGTAEQLWSFTPAANEAADQRERAEAVPLTSDYPGTSKKPMWWDGRVYFASDRDGTMNLWSMTPDGGDLQQHTEHVGWDLRSPQLEGGRIVYQLGADIRVYHIASDADRLVDIRIASDFEQSQVRWIEGSASRLDTAKLSPDGSRVALTMRGEVFVAPTQKGERFVHASRNPGVRYRTALFLDDDELAVLSDQTGEVEWQTLSADGLKAPELWTDGAKVLRMFGAASPDGEYLAHGDLHGTLWLSRRGASESTRLAQANSQIRGFDFSPDSRWLAFSVDGPDTIAQIFLHEITTGETTAVTSLRYDSFNPAFGTGGEWLYFLSDRHFRSEVTSPWGPRQPDPYFKDKTEIYALALTPDAEFPFRRPDEVDEEKKADEKKADEKEKEDEKKDDDDESDEDDEPIEIVLDGLAERLRLLPLEPGNYGLMYAAEKRLLFLRAPAQGWNDRKVLALDLKPDAEVETFAEGVREIQLSADGKKLLVRKRDALYVVDAGGGAPAKLDKDSAVDLSGWRFPLDPREERRQMMRDAWRLHRDYFYDEGMHGVDWPAMLRKYSPLVDRVTTREELNDLIAQMVSEVSALHTFVRGGDRREEEGDLAAAFFGALLQRDAEAGGYRVEHIYRTDPDLPDELAPFAQPDVDVREGDVILAIDGVPTLERPPGKAVRGRAGKPVRIRVAREASEHDEIVEPIGFRRNWDLRYDEWEYTRRLDVEEKGEGALGYVHLRAMGWNDIGDWVREYYPVFRRQGLILDMRHNRGGNIDSWILGKLLRRAWFYWKGRSGEPYWNMQYAFRGHMVVLCDEWTASDGEAFTEGFRRLGLGEVIGTRTWGGEIWLTGSNRLMDGGVATAAEFGVYGPEGEWLIEGHGVDPDIVVDNLPHATFLGEDAQLDAAIEYLQKKIAEDPRPVPEVPDYPDLSWEP